MQVRRVVFLFLLCACAAIPLAHAQDASSAKQFVESVYKRYEKDGIGVPFGGPYAHRFYHSSLLALMRADEKAVGPGEVGVLDGDPICGCQDRDGIWDRKIDLRLEAPDRAIADVAFALGPPTHRSKDDLRHLTITLAPENGQWRIWDIRDESDPKDIFDVRDALEDEIRQLAKPPKTPSKR
jgi:hypothetical protein